MGRGNSTLGTTLPGPIRVLTTRTGHSCLRRSPGESQGFPSVTGYGWYRRRISITEAPGASLDLAVLIPAVDDLYAVYWNGALIGQNGKFPPVASWYLSTTPDRLQVGESARTACWLCVCGSLRCHQETLRKLGGFEATPQIGSTQAIAARQRALDYDWLHSHQFPFGITSLYFLVAMICLLAWFRDRKQWLLFWLAGYTVTPVIRLILAGLRLPWSFAMADGLLQFAIMLQDISLWFLLLWLLKLQDNPRLKRLHPTWRNHFCHRLQP